MGLSGPRRKRQWGSREKQRRAKKIRGKEGKEAKKQGNIREKAGESRGKQGGGSRKIRGRQGESRGSGKSRGGARNKKDPIKTYEFRQAAKT